MGNDIQIGKPIKRGEIIRTPLEFYEGGRWIRCKVEAPSRTYENTYWFNARQLEEKPIIHKGRTLSEKEVLESRSKAYEFQFK